MPSLLSAADTISPVDRETVRVLVVDDDSVLARALQRVLKKEGFEVGTALDGRTALECLDSTPYDVMLLDLRMAAMDGMEVWRRVRERSSPPATIVHSAHVDVRTAVLATRAGVQDVLQKPVPEQILAARIRELAAERRAGHHRPSVSPGANDALVRLVGGSGPMQELREQVRRVACFRDLSVLVQGPTGTGKELVAQAIHALTCPEEPFVSVNCAAVPEQLFESELFGHEAGAFTNAKTSRQGLFEEAGQGTLFLDEVGEMPLPLQAKLLRVLETRQFRRVGGNRTRLLTARVVSATNRLRTSSLKKVMRADLFFRLSGYSIATPSLSEHVSDVPELARHFLFDFAERHGLESARLSSEAVEALLAHTWPGNVRELRAVVENASILSRRGVIGVAEVQASLQARGGFERTSSLPPPLMTVSRTDLVAVRPDSVEPPAAPSSGPIQRPKVVTLPEMQRDVILRAFEQSNQNLAMTARDLGIPRSTLRARLRRYGVR